MNTPAAKLGGPATDLDALLETALARVGGDPRRVWCKASLRFESRLASGRAEILGGVLSPAYLGTEEAPAWCERIEGRTAVCRIASAKEPLEAWLPLLESLVKASASLALVAGEVDDLLLATLLVNHRRAALRNVVVRPEVAPTASSAAPRSSIATSRTPPTNADALLFAQSVWTRRDATALVPEDPTRWEAPTREIAIVEVGGANAADVQARLRALEKRLTEL